jgi:hypothetical protein
VFSLHHLTGVDDMKDKLQVQQKAAQRQKEQLLKGKHAYLIASHDIQRKVLPVLVQKYKGRTARDAMVLYYYLHSYVDGNKQNDTYGWAYPEYDQIVKDTGIHRSRIKELVDLLVKEGLLAYERLPHNGHTKNFYLPLYLSKFIL